MRFMSMREVPKGGLHDYPWLSSFNQNVRDIQARARAKTEMSVCDCLYQDNPREDVFSSCSAPGCMVRHAQTGKRQSLSVSHILILGRLRTLVNRREDTDDPSRTNSLSLTYQESNRHFQNTLRLLDLGYEGYTIHSRRHEGSLSIGFPVSPYKRSCATTLGI